MKPVFFFLFCFSVAVAINAQEIVSPDKRIKVVINSQKASVDKTGPIYFKVLYKKGSAYIEIMAKSPLGIARKDQPFTNDLRLVAESGIRKVHDKYEMICGKRKTCENFGREKIFSFRNSNDQPVDIVFRVYNDGVAFRYIFPNHSDSTVNIISEATTYNLPDSTYRWMQPYSIGYEDFFPFNRTGVSTNAAQEWGFPALFKVNNEPVYVLISEANISENNCGAKLCNRTNANAYQVIYASPRDNFKQTGVTTTLPWGSQWHTL